MLKLDFNKEWIVKKGVNGIDSPSSGEQFKQDKIDLPHDAMIFSERKTGDKDSAGIGYFTTGDYSYTKQYTPPLEDEGKVIYLEFEGIYMNATVIINGNFVGKCPYGYSNFTVKINDYLKYGKENEIKVEVKNSSGSNSRWYSGCGIYRNVKLMIGDPLHIKVDGVRITTLDAEKEIASIEVATDIENEKIGHVGGYVFTVIKDKDGKVVSETPIKFNITSGQNITLRQRIYLDNPVLWSVDNPGLYTCESFLKVDDNIIDKTDTTFGIRKLQLDKVNGLRINGETVKLKGGCIHHDNGLLGAATFEDAEERRIRKLKQAGYNAIRSAHNPISKALLKACDKLGMLVMDEFADSWTQTKPKFDYAFYLSEWWEKDLESMIRKDYNHPCVIMYSIGNEIPETGSDIVASWGRKFVEKIKTIDNTRYITNGLNAVFANMNKMGEIIARMSTENEIKPDEINNFMNNFSDLLPIIMESPIASESMEESRGMLDVVGYNYASSLYDIHHTQNPNNIFVGTETTPSALAENWDIVENKSYVLGDFSWTAWDYLGEVGAGRIVEDDGNQEFIAPFPWIAAYCADFDLVGYRRPISYWREIVWGGRKHIPYISVHNPENIGKKFYAGQWSWTDSISSWTWPGYEGKDTIVEVYSDAEEVELVINGNSQGKKPVGDDFKKFYCKWDTKYQSGEVEAIAYIKGKEVGRYNLITASEPILHVTKENDCLRSGTNDLCFVNIELRDKNGVLNTAAQKMITIKLEGPAIIQASGSANPCTEEYYHENTHETFQGRMMAIVRAGKDEGLAKLTVSCEGMNDVIINIPVV